MRIYVSSTSEDLLIHRALVAEQLSGMGHEVVSMDGYTADSRNPVVKCLDDVASSDAYVGLFAFRYGSIPKGYNRSITEMEFNKACELSLARLIFMVPDCVENWPMKFVDFGGEAGNKMSALRGTLETQDEFTVAYFTQKEDILKDLPKAIQDLVSTSRNAKAKRSNFTTSYKNYIKPLTFEAETGKHLPNFTGRKWVEEKLDSWIAKEKSSKVFCLLGGPGIGKTAIACNWKNTRNDIIAQHYCVHGHAEKTNLKRILLSLISQLAANLPQFERRLSELESDDIEHYVKEDARVVFDHLLLKIFSSDFSPPEKSQIVLIDALDEASSNMENNLARFLGDSWGALPDWLRLVVTSRPEMDVVGYLGNLHPFILNASSHENIQDIRTFLLKELNEETTDEQVINGIVDKSEGMFLYAHLLIDELRTGRLSINDAANFPEGLTGYYQGWFTRKFHDRQKYQDEFHKLVSVIISQKGPLPLSILADTLNYSIYDVQQRLMQLGVLFPLRESNEEGNKSTLVTMMHKSLHDWLTEINPATLYPRAGAFAADPELGNRLLMEQGLQVYKEGRLEKCPYFSQTLLAHLSQADESKKLSTVLMDPCLINSMWSKEFQIEWQSQIRKLRDQISVKEMVKTWIKQHAAKGNNSKDIAHTAGILSSLFQHLGALDEAMLLADRALEIWGEIGVSDSSQMVTCLLARGSILCTRDCLDEATESFEKAQAIAENTYDENSEELAQVYYQLNSFYNIGKRDYKQAWIFLQKSLKIRRRITPINHAGIADCINDQAVLMNALDMPGNYLEMYREALTHFEQTKSKGHPEMVATLCNIATELQKQGQSKDAEKELRRALRLANKTLLPQHEYHFAALTRLANLLYSTHQYEEAFDHIRTNVRELERNYGQNHKNTTRGRINFCNALWNAIYVSEKELQFQFRNEYLDQIKKITITPPYSVLELLNLADASRRIAEQEMETATLGVALKSCSGYAEKNHEIPEEVCMAQHFSTLINLIIAKNSLTSISEQIRKAWTIAEDDLRGCSDYLPKFQRYITQLISWVGKERLGADEDVEGAREAYKLIEEIGANSPDTLDRLAEIASSLHYYHYNEHSAELYTRLHKKSEELLGADNAQTLRFLGRSADIYTYLYQFSEAERRSRSALESWKTTVGPDNSNFLTAFVSLLRCLLLQNKVKEAIRELRKIESLFPNMEDGNTAMNNLGSLLNESAIQLKNNFSEFDGAKLCYEYSLKFSPKNAHTHGNFALMLWVCMNEPESAKDHFEMSLELDPNNTNNLGNFAHMLAQHFEDFEESNTQFRKALKINPNLSSVLGNYSASKIQQSDLNLSWKLAKKAMRLGLIDPDRLLLRPLFCATAVLMLKGQNADIPLGQLKHMFKKGTVHAPWLITGLLAKLEQELPSDNFKIISTISEAISTKEALDSLESLSRWIQLDPVSLNTPWPVMA